ncbi:MAG TPA: dephospho-CoA kinase [Melioribacteraceae bacterium]|nr:dephospho-CoA kinase [Melioribacteraceae bacterium]
MDKPIKIGITGGIGSGKSIVSDLIEKSGFAVIRSDLVAKELMATDQKILGRIVKTFGKESVAGGKLNTHYLAGKVFNNKKNVELINSIVHPPVIRKINEMIESEFAKSKIVFVESALIFEAKIKDMFDYVVLIYTAKDLRIKRVIKRDKTNESDIISRMTYQIDDELKRDKVDFILENNSTLAELKIKVSFLLKLLNSIASSSN